MLREEECGYEPLVGSPREAHNHDELVEVLEDVPTLQIVTLKVVVLLRAEEVHGPEHKPCDDLDTVHLPVGGHDDLQIPLALHVHVQSDVEGSVIVLGLYI